ncbi:MAG: hypothetical protein KA521_00620 [Crocinitomicaceae bacterium]|nr:hypothetical protein [Crocinitomicaceae bacterium]
MKKHILAFTILFSAAFTNYAQVTTATSELKEYMVKKPQDPLLKFKNFLEIGLTASAVRVNTNMTTFYTPSGIYHFKKNDFLPALDGSINYGWLIKGKNTNSIWTVKTGVNMITRAANLTDNLGNELRFTTGYIQFPLQFGFRIPLNYNPMKNNLFRAVDYNFGMFAAIPLMQKLDFKDNIDSKAEKMKGYFISFGFIGEITFSALDSRGHGHKFGLKTSVDLSEIISFNKTTYELFPVYSSIGIFYNITNQYK